jgi:hypothetical protein
MTGISEINTQYSGMELEYNVDIVVTGPTTFIMTVSSNSNALVVYKSKIV